MRLAIMAACGLGLQTIAGAAFRPGLVFAGLSGRAMGVSTRARTHFFLGVLFAGVSDSRADRAAWNSAGAELSFRGCASVGGTAFLVRSHRFLVVGERSHIDGGLHCWNDCFRLARNERGAAGNVGYLPDLFSFLYRRRADIRQLPVRWDAAGSWIHRHVFCAWWLAAALGSCGAAFAREPVPPGMADVSNLF